ncbi:MAG: glycosyltransferase family 2 protein [Candidatus Paceibacterota bacterium]
MKENPDISIVVLNYNTSDLLNGALQSIVETVGDLHVDVAVIDNASTDGGFAQVSAEIKTNPLFTFIQRDKNVGWAAINSMLAKKGRYILTLDPDAVLHPGALQTLLAFMDRTPKAGAATAKLLNSDGTPQLYYRRIMTPKSAFFMTVFGRIIDKYFFGLRQFKRNRYDDLNLDVVSEVEQPAWPCLIWRREALGPYVVDERIPFYFVDVDMSKRVYDNGYKIYLVPQATITHLKSASFGRTNDTWRRNEYNRSIRVYMRQHYPRSYLALAPVLAIDRMLRAAIRMLTGKEPLR